MSRPTSSATAAKSSVGGVTLATSVATRRSAACSSAERRALGARGLELASGLRVGDRGRDELGETGESRLGVGRRRFVAQRPDTDRAPDTALDRDRHTDSRADADRQPVLDVGLLGVVVEPHRAPGLSHQRGQGTPLKSPRVHGGQGRPTRAVSGDERRRVVGVEPNQSRHVGGEQPADLLGDRGEKLRRRCSARDERRHATKRGLLVGDRSHLLARLGVRDRGRDELGEVGEALLRTRGQRTAAREDGDLTPRPPREHDRAGDPRLRVLGADEVVDQSPDRSGVDSDRASAEQLRHAGHRWAGIEAEADGRSVGHGAADGEESPQPIRVVSREAGLVRVQQLVNLLGDRSEDLVGGSTTRDERRHPPQRRLLVGDRAQLLA